MNGSPDLSVEIGRLVLKNPVMPASGTFGYGKEYETFLDLDRLGAIVVKTITLKPRTGSRPRRSTEVPSGLLATIGLQNVGIDRFINEKLRFFESLTPPLIVSIGGETIEEYAALCRKLDNQARVDAIELNVSCPNVRRGGIHFGCDPEALKELITRTRESTGKVLIVKLSPLVADISGVARIARDSGADAISLMNGLPGLAIDIEARRSKMGRNLTGGLVGPSLKPFALYLVRKVYENVDIPVIGVGGIASPEDAVEFLIAGASAIQIGTFNFLDPAITVKAIEGIEAYLIRHGIDKLASLIGSLKT